MTHRFALVILALIATYAALPAHAEGALGIRSQTVQFAKGATSVQLKGSIKGDAGVDYKISARAGQTLAVTMKPSNASTYFNILPPGSESAMFIGSTSGATAKVVLPDDGVYIVRVYLMRNASRRNETSNYTLTVGVTGKPLAPLAAAKDALIPVRNFMRRHRCSARRRSKASPSPARHSSSGAASTAPPPSRSVGRIRCCAVSCSSVARRLRRTRQRPWRIRAKVIARWSSLAPTNATTCPMHSSKVGRIRLVNRSPAKLGGLRRLCLRHSLSTLPRWQHSVRARRRKKRWTAAAPKAPPTRTARNSDHALPA